MLEGFLPKLERGALRSAVRKLIAQLRGKKEGFFSTLPVASYSVDEIWDVYSEVHGLLALLDEAKKDLYWESGHG